MEKEMPSSLFVNDGSFMEKFKQLQQDKEKERSTSSHEPPSVSGSSTPKPVVLKTGFESKVKDSRKMNAATPSGKLAFSLKQKSKIVAPAVKLGEDEDEDRKDAEDSSANGPLKRQKLIQPDTSVHPVTNIDVVTPPPSDPTVRKVADKLASFVAKNGRQFEHITRQKNPGDTPFKFLCDESCADYKYYEYRLIEEEKALSYSKDMQPSQDGGSSSTASTFSGSQRSHQQHSHYQIPASALYGSADNMDAMAMGQATAGTTVTSDSSGPAGTDPIAMMEFYMKKAAREEKMRQPKLSKDEMPPPASLQASGKRGHHMGDFIPQEQLEKFLASCNDVSAQKAAKEATEKAKIQADNVGHKLLSRMGWKEGEGLGGSRKGIADPIMAGSVKTDNLGVGAQQPGEVTADDDIYEQYKKRMMLGYRYRPNPLGNPRKQYY